MATLTSPDTEAIPDEPGEVRPEPARPRTRSTVGTVAGNILLLAGALVLAFAGFLTGGSRLQEAHSQHLLYDQLRVTLEHSTTPVAEPITPGTPVALLDVPRLGAAQVVVEGTASRDLMRGPGHRPDTVLPGQQGVSVLMGRANTYGGPFARLHLLRVGDRVTVTTGQGTFRYLIDSVRSSAAPFRPLPPAAARLSLVTSDGSWTPSHVWVGSGVLQGTAQAASTGLAPAAVADQPLQGDGGAAVALLLWSQALLLAVVLAVWGWQRLPRVTVWVGAAPVLLALLWNVFTNLSALLPNLL